MNLVISSTITMTSLELVDFINQFRKQHSERAGLSVVYTALRHDHFMEKVARVLGSEGLPKFRETYHNSQNGQSYPCYRFPKREACLMAMSYSYDLQAAVFDRMTELESAERKAALPDFSDPVAAARAWADATEQKQIAQQLLAIAAPKVEFVDKYVEATGLKGFRQVAKLLGANEPEFRLFLSDNKIMYKLGTEWVPYASHIDAGRFAVKTGQAENGHAFNSAKFTPKGIEYIARLWNNKGEAQ